MLLKNPILFLEEEGLVNFSSTFKIQLNSVIILFNFLIFKCFFLQTLNRREFSTSLGRAFERTETETVNPIGMMEIETGKAGLEE